MNQIHWMAVCNDCEKTWYSKNVMGVAAIHHKKTGHEVYVEIVSAHYFGYRAAERDKEPVLYNTKPKDYHEI